MSERSTPGKSVTAADPLAKQANDPTLQAQRRARDEALEAQRGEWRRAERPLVQELATVGLQVESSWDLVNTAQPYPDAIPILARHLERSYPDRVREGIARALAVPAARGIWDVLLRCYSRAAADSDAKQGIAAALAAAAGSDTVGDLVSLISDPANGSSRVLLVQPLVRSQDERAAQAIAALRDDPELRIEIREMLATRDRRRR